MTSPDYWDEAKAALSKRDKVMKKLIASYEGETMQLRGEAFYTLARSIVGQQISVKAADTVWNRVMMAADKITPRKLANIDAAILRSCGLSERKVMYMHALANHFLDNKDVIKNWPNMTDDEIIKELTSIKGIGRWTVEMLLIFHLGRPDVYPVADIGLQKAVFKHYNKNEPMNMLDFRALGERWRPYRTVATWYLWRALDPVPVEY
jgi:DNA-3-methyladenine glycosylase II